MAVHNGASDNQGWSDLPGDLLAVLYQRSASAFDRARFAAVCTSWRNVAAWHPRLPALPLLLPSTGDAKRDMEALAYSPEDGRALRVPLQWFPGGNRLVGSYQGGWIATASCLNELLVVNVFSGAPTPLSANQRVGCPDGGWTTLGCGIDTYKDLVDITFCNGELFSCTHTELFKFDVGVNRDGAPVASPIHRLDIEISALHVPGVETLTRHIFELRGKLAIAVKVFTERGHIKDTFFKVFELSEGDAMWEEVTSLGEHTLFLGRASSKAVHVTSMEGQRGVVKGNHIYYSEHHLFLQSDEGCLAKLDIGSCTVRCWDSKGTHHLEKILSWGYHSYEDDSYIGCNSCMWLWPPDF